MSYIGTQPNNVKKNIGLYNPSEILQLTKDGHWGGSLEHIATQTYSSSVSSVIFENLALTCLVVEVVFWKLSSVIK